ncbi:MAG TPA: AI-2E family transporter [Candidatus Gracilibacteria bacterium]|nr:AI-2E family transporter [Candidatus Gracilibacteria bacterium]
MKNKKGSEGFLAVWMNKLTGKIDSIKQHLEKMKEEKRMSFETANVPKKELSGKSVLEISPSSAAKATAYVILLLALCYFLYDIRGTLLIFFLSFLLAAALDPLIDWMQARHIPRSISVLLFYVVIFVLIGIFVTNVVSLVASQIVGISKSVGDFVTNITRDNSPVPWAKELKPYLNQIYAAVDIKAAASQVQGALMIVSDKLLTISFGLFNLIIVLLLTFFMTVEEKTIENFLLSLFPSKYGQYISTRMEAIKEHIGQWLRGQLMVSIAAGFVSYIGLVMMGIDYALTLSILAGICMVVPMMGRVFAWALTFPIVFNQSPMLSLYMSIYYLLIQQVENNVLQPMIMNKAVGLSPIIIIFSMMIGYQYLNILGLILAIPLATIVAIFVQDYTARVK